MSVPKVLFTQDTGAQSSKNGKKRNNIRVYECGYMIATKIKNQCFLIVFQTEWPWSTSSCQYTEKQCPTTTWEKKIKNIALKHLRQTMLLLFSHLRNWSILVKLIFHRCLFSIYHADSENVIKNFVSAWTPEIPAKSGSPFAQI